MRLLIIILLFVCIMNGQYSNSRNAIIGGFFNPSETLTPQKEKMMEKQINQAMDKLRKMKRFTWSNSSGEYIYVARFSWYPTKDGGSAGRYELDKDMFNQMKRSWFTDITTKKNIVYAPNVNFDSSVVGYSLFVGYASEKYIREHKNDKIDTTMRWSSIDSSGNTHYLTKEEIANIEIERQKRKLERLKEIQNRTFRVIKFINNHTLLIDRKPSFEIEELQSEIKPPDYIEGLCNCFYD